MPFSNTELLTIVAGSSVIAAAMTQAVGVFRDWWNAKRDGKFSALYLAIALESYADQCATLVADSQNYESTDGHAGTSHGNLVGMPDYPAAVEWKPFGIKDTTRAMSLRVEIDTRKASFSGHWEFGDAEEIVPLVREEAARLGSKALELAASFRKAWSLTPVDYRAGWNVRGYLAESLESHRARRQEYENMQRNSHDELFGDIESEHS